MLFFEKQMKIMGFVFVHAIIFRKFIPKVYQPVDQLWDAPIFKTSINKMVTNAL
jgi:hypothetical protein